MPSPHLSIEAIRLPAFLYRPDGTILAVNDLAGVFAGRELAGCSAADAVRIFTHRRLDGTPLTPAELPDSRALAGEEVIEAPLAVTVADGRTLRILVTASPIREDGALAGALVLWQDVTGCTQAERELARYADDLRGSREQLGDVIEATGAGFYQIALERMEGTISRRGAEILGFATPEMPSLFEIMAEAQARMHPDDLQGVLGSFMTFVEAETERNEVEFRVRSLDGGWRWVQAISTSAKRNAAGRVVMLAGFLFDIDERKKAEAALRRSNEELQRFAYMASHDLQEPLRSLVSFSQLLERRYRGRLDSDADEYIAFIVEGGNRMQRLIEDLLRVSRVETTAKPLEPTNSTAVVADVERAMETSLREAGATLEAGDLPMVRADAAQLEQVFMNLIGNAIKYRHPDRPPAIRIAARRVGPMVQFAVQDNGIGIEPEYHDLSFEMFRRLHTHDEYEGTGIGLAVVLKIVERHGGKVWVESTPWEGSTFIFTLPAA
ncbi:MAG: ATP-binding protein [Methanospirillum sp.]